MTTAEACAEVLGRKVKIPESALAAEPRPAASPPTLASASIYEIDDSGTLVKINAKGSKARFSAPDVEGVDARILRRLTSSAFYFSEKGGRMKAAVCPWESRGAGRGSSRRRKRLSRKARGRWSTGLRARRRVARLGVFKGKEDRREHPHSGGGAPRATGGAQEAKSRGTTPSRRPIRNAARRVAPRPRNAKDVPLFVHEVQGSDDRSKKEARLFRFFDAVGVPYRSEKEAFGAPFYMSDGTEYTPDGVIYPDSVSGEAAMIEVKPFRPTMQEVDKAKQAVAQSGGMPLFFVWWKHFHQDLAFYPEEK